MNETGRFVSGEKRSFGEKPGKKAVDVILPPGLANKFEIEEKNMPDRLPASWNDFQLVWINNIGLKAKSAGARLETGEFYEVQFQKVPLPGPQTILVYWDGSKVVEIPADDYGDAGGGKMAVRLRLIDPPIGIGGR